jgi:signal transduction histidine kinase
MAQHNLGQANENQGARVSRKAGAGGKLRQAHYSPAGRAAAQARRMGVWAMKTPSPNPGTDGDLDIDFLHEIATRMALAPPLHEVLRELVRFTSAVVECDSCFVYVLEKDELVLRASKNPHPEIVDRLKLKMGEGITGWVAEHREPVAVAMNAMKDPRFKFFNDLPEDQFEAFLSVPLVCRGRLVGVINLQNRRPHSYSKREISLISTVGALVGAEIEMARLQDEERRRIGREVHDSMGQELTAAKLYLRRIPEHSYADAHWSSFVKEAAGAVDRALQQVRSLSYLLHPPFAEDMGLLTAVRYYVEGVSQRTGIQVKAMLPKELPRLPFEMEATIFRVVQESLTNVFRHSNSKVAELELRRSGESVHLKIRDYGASSASEKLQTERAGVGVSGMRERVQGLGGTFRIYDAHPGTVVEAELPIAPAASKPA